MGCHTKLKAKFTHSAITSVGCAGCHEAETKGENTEIKLRETGNALCLQCHEDKNPAELKGRVHDPVVSGECATCHDPHSSNNPNQLVQPVSGEPNENLCLTCHDIGVDVPPNGSRHAALDAGCDSCHTTHKTGDPAKQEFAFHLNESSPSLCTGCHTATDKDLIAAHRGQPFAQTTCVGCHSPHQSVNAKLIHKNVHAPFDARECDACHQPARDNKVVINEDGKRELCYTCHDTIKDEIAAAKVPHGVFDVDDSCTTCHSPHATPFPKQMVQPQIQLCETCHTQRAEEKNTRKFIHSPAAKDGCAVCHKPHGGDTAGMLRAGTNELCLTCHARDAKGEANSTEKVTFLFGGSVQLPGDYMAKVKKLPLRQGASVGHPQAGHPITGVDDPLHQGKKISCTSCHDPHAGNGSVHMFVTGTKSSSPLCIQCHK